MRRVLVLALLLTLQGCGDPLALREAPPADRSIRLFMVLDPDSAWHALFLESLDPGGIYRDLRAELYTDGALIGVGEAPNGSTPSPAPSDPCAERYGTLGYDGAFACLVFETTVERGRSYELVVSARDRPTARARTVVPDSFAITAVNLDGRPPGTDGFEVHWHASPGAYGYFVFLRAESTHCPDVHGCSSGWLVTTRDTTVAGTIPAELLEGGSGPWSLGVLALDRGLYEYFTTGTGNDLFSVPPVEYVEGGHGVLGSWAQPTPSAGPGLQ